MSALGTVAMLGICLFVWGGFVAFLVRAVRCESAKAAADRE